jgi:hypothetical protein
VALNVPVDFPIGESLIAVNTHCRPLVRRGVTEQVTASFSVHFRFERVPVFEGCGLDRSRPGIHKV